MEGKKIYPETLANVGCGLNDTPVFLEAHNFLSLRRYFSIQDLDFVIKGISDERTPESCTIVFSKKPYEAEKFAGLHDSVIIARNAIVIQNGGQHREAILSEQEFKCVFSEIVSDYVECLPDIEPLIHPSAIIGEGCTIEKNVRVGANAAIGSHCVIRKNVLIGENVTIGDGCILGCEDADCYSDASGAQKTVPHAKGVYIMDGSMILAGAVIAAGSSIRTTIGKQCVIGGRAWIAHNVLIGNGAKVMAGAVICGYCTLGENVYLGAGAIVKNRLTIEDNAFIGMGSVVTKSVKANRKVFGNPAQRIGFTG